MKKARNALGVVYRKELLDSLRDRRALISMIAVPLLVIPLLMIAIGGFTVKMSERAEEAVYTVSVIGGEAAPAAVAAVSAVGTLRLVDPGEDVRAAIVNGYVQAALLVPEDFEERIARGESAGFTILTYAGEPRSALAAGRIQAALNELREEIVRERLEEAGLEEQLLRPFTVEMTNVAPPEKVTGALLGGLLPYLLIVLSMTGAIYPAMDLTAGEKERGTMETLLSSPISRLTLVLGKFFVVMTFSILTALLALAALTGSFWFAFSRLPGAGSLGELALSPGPLAALFLLLLPMAALFSALLLAVGVFARTFREAQTYVSPLLLIAILPSAGALMPGMELTPLSAVTPVLNISLIGRDLMIGMHEWKWIGLILISSTVYAGIALAVAVKLFRKESVIFRE